MPAPLPEPPHRTGEPLRELHVTPRDRPVQSGAQVVVILDQAVQPEGLTGSGEMRGNLLRDCEVGRGMASADVVRIAALLEAARGEHAHRGQQPEPGPER